MNKMLVWVILASAYTATPALAEKANSIAHATVRHADLDLASIADMARLDRRIRTAIEDVCGELTDFDPVGANAIRRCRAMAKAAVAPRRANLISSARPNVIAAR